MEKRTLIKKLLKYTLLFILIAVIGFFSYIRYGGYVLISKEDREKVISEIKASPQLPDNFMTVYNDLYPKALTNSAWNNVFNEVVFHRYNECPSSDVAYMYGAYRLHGAFFYLAQLNFVLEDNLTQQQCLNKSLKELDFTNHVIGVENFAMTYFGKPLKDLNEDQVLEILVRVRNPLLYNKERQSRRQIFMDRFNTLKSELKKNRTENK